MKITKEELYDLYWNNNLTVNEIAKKYSVSPSFITRRMIKYKIKRRNMSEIRIGKSSWCKGLTKENSIKVKKRGEKTSKTRKRLFKEGKLKPPIKFKLTKEELYDLYWNKKLDVPKIAEKLGLGQTTIWRWMERLGIKGRTNSESKLKGKYKPKKEELYDLYWKKGLSTVKIGEKFGFNNNVIRVWLKQYGIKVRELGIAQSNSRLLSKEKLDDLYVKQKLSCKKIGKFYGIDDESIRKLLRHFNIERRDNVGENNAFWQGGIADLPYPYEFRKIKKLIKERDNYTCQECGKQFKGKNQLDIHHIDYNKKNSKPENLITLCKSCHGKTKFIRGDWINHFQNKINLSIYKK